MPDFAYYQVYLRAGLREAERYLLSSDLFWPLNIVPPLDEPIYPALTLGGLLLYHAFARPHADMDSKQSTLQQLDNELEGVRTRWRVAWESKAKWEFKSRLRQWGNVIKEIRVDPEDNIPYYQYEVRLRVMLSLLQDDLQQVTQDDSEEDASEVRRRDP